MDKITTLKKFSLALIFLAFWGNTFAQQIGVLGNSIYIADGDTTPSVSDFTDFDGSTTRTFYVDNIQNSGNTTLTISSITLLSTADFSITSPLSDTTITKNQSPEPFTITLTNVTPGTYTTTVQIVSSNASNDGGDNTWTFDITASVGPEINVTGNAQNIVSGDVTPDPADDTDFGITFIGFPLINTFTIENIGSSTLNVSSVTLSGVNPGDFSVSTAPASSVASSSNTTFNITFSPTVLGLRSAIVTIANDDSDESSYTFTVEGTANPPSPEINIQGNGVTIADGETITTTADHTDFGNVNQGSSLARTFTIQNTGAATLTIGSTVSLTNGTDFTVTTQPATTTIAASGSTTFIITLSPLSSGSFTDVVTITNDDTDENPYTYAISGTSYLIEAGGSWSYLDDGSDQGTAWQNNTDYLTVPWATGNAQLGFGDGDESTLITDINQITNYFRRSFTATATDVANTTLNLNALRDDGMVVYINGVEVWRDNMPTTAITYTTLASSNIAGSEETTWLSLNISNVLVVGNNEIGVEIHQDLATSSDVSFDFFMYTSNDYVFVPPTQPDNDLDSIADYKDSDDDNDGITDQLEGCFSGQLEDLNSDPWGAGSEESIEANFPFTQPLDDGNSIDYSFTGTFSDITSWDAGDHGWSIRVKGPGTAGTMILDFATPVDNLTFRLVDFDENETWTINAYDDSNNLIDLITNVNIYYLGSYITQTGNTVTDSTDGLSTNNPGEDIASDQYGTAYFYFPNTKVSRIEFIVDQPDGSTIRLAAIEYCNQDTDGDTIEDYHDSDSDNDGIPDLVEAGGTDTDGDGIIDDLTDTDGDGIADLLDADVSNYNTYEATKLLPYIDFDGDGVFNSIDLDSDNDGIADIIEIGETDANGDGQIDGFTDTDSDGYHDSYDGITSRLITGADAGADGFPDTYPNANLDNTGFPNFKDIDSDDDGITDNTEAQATGSYITFVATDTDGDGIPNIFDASGSFGGAGLTPVDSDIDGAPDYLDINSDDAEENDIIEGHDTNGDGVVNGSDSPNADTGLFTGTDTDGDGLDDGFDNNDAAFNSSNGALQPTSHPIFDAGSDRDWRSTQAALDFDGMDDHIDYGDEAAYEFSSDFSIEAWVLQETTVTTGTIISKSNAKAGNEKGYKLVLNSSVPNLKWYDNSNVLIVDLVSPYAINNDRWYHIAATYDGTTAELYIDGIMVASDTPSGSPSYDTEKFVIGATYDSDTPTSPKHHFNGFIDEVRVWNTALKPQQLREMMNQEIVQNGTAVRGSVLPIDISGGLLWTNLEGYYPMTNDSADDQSSNTRNGSPKNINSLQLQTAPLPYTTKADGDWDDNTAATPWTLGDSVWDQPNGLGVDGVTKIDWNIVQISHDVDSNDEDITLLGLVSDTPGKTLVMANDTETLDEYNTGQMLWVTHYLKLDGDIDLVGESQLVQKKYDVTNQTSESILASSSSGSIERDQQGTADTYTYNYWSSPVSPTGSANNEEYALPEVFMNGTVSATPNSITFLPSGYDGAASGNNRSLADYWIWKYANAPAGDYSQWQHVRSTSDINAGEGFTMKGPGSGVITADQNYVFNGKPNNGDIDLSITEGYGYLLGNPYASAIDANQFILDNAAVIAGQGTTDGTLYFWEHWGGGSHITTEYQGGYGMYNMSGATPSASNGALHGDLDPSGSPTGSKTPGRYIPVGQGFFVTALVDGTVSFNNAQRVFQRENGSSSSTFMRAANTKKGTTTETISETRLQIRLGFNSVGDYRRQILLTKDENASSGIDLLYDAGLWDYIPDDMYWLVNYNWYGIQGTNEINSETVLPLGIHTATDGVNTVTIDELKNVPNDLEIYIHDKELNIYHDLRLSDYEVYLTANFYTERFEITFSQGQSLGTEDFDANNMQVFYSNEITSVVIHNPTLKNVDSVELFNVLGQSIIKFDDIINDNTIELKTKQARGIYIIKVKSEGETLSKKVLIK